MLKDKNKGKKFITHQVYKTATIPGIKLSVACFLGDVLMLKMEVMVFFQIKIVNVENPKQSRYKF